MSIRSYSPILGWKDTDLVCCLIRLSVVGRPQIVCQTCTDRKAVDNKQWIRSGYRIPKILDIFFHYPAILQNRDQVNAKDCGRNSKLCKGEKEPCFGKV